MEKLSDRMTHIKGWGIDADPSNEPTYPMKSYTGDDHERLRYKRPPMQKTESEILHSNERPGRTAVFGSTLPPKGLSGVLRRVAFRYSEGSFKHWMTLLLADRVNVVEGYIDDLSHGKIPNVFAEQGWGAIYRHDKKLFAKKVVINAAITAGIVLLAVKMCSTSRRK